MKSIKEKANEYAKDYLFSSIGRGPNVHFEAGANYVLDEIEEVLSLLPDTTARRVVANKIKELKGK